MLDTNSREYMVKMNVYNKYINEIPEVWKTIKIGGYDTKCEVSNHGRFINHRTGHTIEPSYDSNEYIRVRIPTSSTTTTHISLHRLVARYFCTIPKRITSIGLNYNDLVVVHRNGIKRCNAAFNLQWCTQYENMQNAFTGNIKSHSSRISEETAISICELIMEKKTNEEISKILGVTNKTVQHIRAKECWNQVTDAYDFPKLSTVVPYSIPDSKIHDVCKYLQEHKYTDTEIAEKTGLQRRYITEIRNGDKRLDISSLYDIDRSAVTRDLTENIHEVCRLLEIGELSQRKIAKIAGVSQNTVSNVFNRKKYTEISSKYNF